MKKLDPGQIIAILANVGVILGIVFLVLELQQLEDQMDAQIDYNLFSSRIERIAAIATDNSLAEIIDKYERDVQLNRIEEIRLDSYVRSVVFGWEYEWQQHHKRRSDEFDLQEIVDRLERNFWGVADQWDNMRDTVLESGFVDAVENELGPSG